MSLQTAFLFVVAGMLMVFGIDQEDRYLAMGLSLTANICWAIDRLRRFS